MVSTTLAQDALQKEEVGEELGKGDGAAEDGIGQAAAGDDVGGEREGDCAEIGDAEPDIALRDECAQAPQGPLMATETAGQDVAADNEEYLCGAGMQFEQVEHAADQRGRPLTQGRIEREVVPDDDECGDRSQGDDEL